MHVRVSATIVTATLGLVALTARVPAAPTADLLAPMRVALGGDAAIGARRHR